MLEMLFGRLVVFAPLISPYRRDRDAVRRAFETRAAEIADETGEQLALEAVAEGYLRIGVDRMAQAIKQLPEKERLVISLYYLDELTMKETGKVLGITESRVSQIHSQAILHLRAKLRKQHLLDD